LSSAWGARQACQSGSRRSLGPRASQAQHFLHEPRHELPPAPWGMALQPTS